MELKQPSLITATILLILGLGVFYFLDSPQYDKDKAQRESINDFSAKKKNMEDHTRVIGEIGIKINKSNWTEKKKKIEPNFTSTPFFIPKMEYFFSDLVKRSNMTLLSVSFQTGGSLTEVTTTTSTTQKSGAVNPVEDESLNIPKNQSGVIGIKGPVKKNTFNLSVSGGYQDMKNLLAIFEKQAYLISVKSLSFGEGKNNQFNFTITGDIYSY
jgi:preprotein translocase subunit YajC